MQSIIRWSNNSTDDKEKPLEDDVHRNFEIPSSYKEEIQPILLEPSPLPSSSSPKSSSAKLATEEQDSQPAPPSSAESGLTKTPRIANAYNEMMAHMAMFSHASSKRFLVIGGGDGYVLHEVSY